ncbi:MAG: LicD family protein [Clostridia bacterium]|nr:LicD family protein [Clostridia bacterium]
MKELTNDEVKALELDVLLNVASFCEKYNLTYYLAYGTLIGAVRHKGFIPWDDDIDIMMPRDDYNQLIAIFNQEMANTPYVAVDPWGEGAAQPFLKIGNKNTMKVEPEYEYKGAMIDIDVFPIDGMPDDEEEYDRWYDKMKRLYTAHFYQRLKKKNKKFNIRIFAKKILWGCWLSSKRFLKKTKKEHGKYPYHSSRYVGVLESCWNSKKNRVLKESFEGTAEVEFEGYCLKAPSGYHEILTNIYGDYMKLPPIENQVAEHDFIAYLKENEK